MKYMHYQSCTDTHDKFKWPWKSWNFQEPRQIVLNKAKLVNKTAYLAEEAGNSLKKKKFT